MSPASKLPKRVSQFPHLYRIAQIDASSLRKDGQKIYLANPPVWKCVYNLRLEAKAESLLRNRETNEGTRTIRGRSQRPFVRYRRGGMDKRDFGG